VKVDPTTGPTHPRPALGGEGRAAEAKRILNKEQGGKNDEGKKCSMFNAQCSMNNKERSAFVL